MNENTTGMAGMTGTNASADPRAANEMAGTNTGGRVDAAAAAGAGAVAGPEQPVLTGADRERNSDGQEILLRVNNLNVHFHTHDQVVHAVRGVSFWVARGRDPGAGG